VSAFSRILRFKVGAIENLRRHCKHILRKKLLNKKQGHNRTTISKYIKIHIVSKYIKIHIEFAPQKITTIVFQASFFREYVNLHGCKFTISMSSIGSCVVNRPCELPRDSVSGTTENTGTSPA